MQQTIDNMNAVHLDVFREIGNIGSSSAATAMSKIVEGRINISLPNVKIMGFNEITQVLGGEEELVIGILQPITGDLTGNIMFLMKRGEAHDLATILLSRMLNVSADGDENDAFSEMELSALREIGNILISSYLSSISSMTNLRVIPRVPEIAIDMAGAVLSVLAIEFGKVGDKVLYIESEFSQDQIKVGGDFFLVPDIDSYNTLLNALGVD